MEVAVFAARAAAYLGHYRKSAQSYQNNETHHAANAAGNGQWAMGKNGYRRGAIADRRRSRHEIHCMNSACLSSIGIDEPFAR